MRLFVICDIYIYIYTYNIFTFLYKYIIYVYRYELMLKCWCFSSDDRPSFFYLLEHLEKFRNYAKDNDIEFFTNG